MQFAVVHKGLRHFTGSLDAAIAFVESNWTSPAKAYEIGVKLVPLSSRPGRPRNLGAAAASFG